MNEIISYLEMCQREGFNLQKGMNFLCNPSYSVILMSIRPNAPYRDAIADDGATLIYEGHDEPNTRHVENPKLLDQPEFTISGRLTENGKFHQAAQRFKLHGSLPELVRVYEKIKSGIWSYNGLFHLIDSWTEHDGKRYVFRFELVTTGTEDVASSPVLSYSEPQRIIPSSVKLEVWKPIPSPHFR